MKFEQIRRRMMGCWLGKSIGGTLGAPWEGHDGPLDLTFYDPVPTRMLPNDDLDLQVVWACALDGADRPRVDRRLLAQAWLDHVNFPFDEYGVAIRNLRSGICPPFSGSFDNWFRNGMGAAIRTEIWACLSPGDPDRAASFAYEDACVDHAEEGIWAPVFLAALQSLAFVEQDVDCLLDAALARLPETSLVRRAVTDTRGWWREYAPDWRTVRQHILRHYGHENFTDVTMNLAFITLGWLAGNGDFSRAICVATNCGKDTDCTAATVGALMGILNPDGIDPKWLEPIGRTLVLNRQITGIHPPHTLDGFTDLVASLHRRLADHQPSRDFAADVERPVVEPIVADLAFAAELSRWERDAACPTLPDARREAFAGTWVRWPAEQFRDAVARIRYRFILPSPSKVRVMFNSRQPCGAWLDSAFIFSRAGGVMAPSFHRAPPHQFADAQLDKGAHELVVEVARPEQGGTAEWVVGIGDATSGQWLIDVFERGTFTVQPPQTTTAGSGMR